MPWSRAWRRWKVLVGDKVQIVHGPAKGQTGTVKRVFRDEKEPRVIVEGCNLRWRYSPGDAAKGVKGQRVQIEAPLPYASVNVLDPKTSLPVRVGYAYLEDGTKVRVGRGRGASGEVIPRPPRKEPTRPAPGPKDTSPEEVLRVTYRPGESLPDYIDPDTLEPSGAAGFHPLGAQPYKPWTFGFHPLWKPKNPRVSMQSVYSVFRVPGWPSRHDFKGKIHESLVAHPPSSPGFPIWDPIEEARRAREAEAEAAAAALPEGPERDRRLAELPRNFAALQHRALSRRRFEELLGGFAALGVDPTQPHPQEATGAGPRPEGMKTELPWDRYKAWLEAKGLYRVADVGSLGAARGGAGSGGGKGGPEDAQSDAQPSTNRE